MSTSDEMRKVQHDLIALALDVAKDGGVALDFTETSIEQVDAILQALHEAYQNQVGTDQQREDSMYGIALEMAAYIIEVIERTHGRGTWERNSKTAGEETWPYAYRSVTIFPVAWCLKQIQNGEEDSVAHKYRYAFLEKLDGSS